MALAQPKSHRRILLPGKARAAAVEKHAPELARAIAIFFESVKHSIVDQVTTLYAKAQKADDDKIKRILRDLDFSSWGDLSPDVQAALVVIYAEGAKEAANLLPFDAEPGFWDALNTEALNYAKARSAELVGMK